MALHDDQKESEIARKFKRNPALFTGTVLILILVIISFVFWGAGDWILPKRGVLSNDELTFGYYDKIPIEFTPGSFFAEQRRYNLEQMRQYRNERYATEQAFNLSVVRAAILETMKKAPYEPPKSLVDRKVAELPRYQENGVFSLLRYRADSTAQRRTIYNQVRDSVIIGRYYDDVSRRDIKSDGDSATSKYSWTLLNAPQEADFIGSMAKIQRKFKIALFPYSLYPNSEASAWAEENAGLFKNTHLSQITLGAAKDATEAQKVLDSIKNGTTTFEDAAKTYSEDSYKQAGGDAGTRMAWELAALIPDETERSAVVDLAAGELSSPVKLADGWGIFRAESAAEAANTDDEAVLTKIRNYMTESEPGIIEDWLIERASSFGKDVEGGSWDIAIFAYNVESKDFGPIPLNYGNNTLFSRISEPAPLDSAATSENFWKRAFSTPVGKPTEPFVISSGQQTVVVILPVEEITDEEAAKNTINLYKTSFIENEIMRSVDDAFLNSPKLKNNFEPRYATLFSSTSNLD
ncbi:MAG: peptidylprolyl isomerase [Spirochaetaceae bacterium]|jgi:hypothetical protein|nr:peptidylprolyl isomerase [Spirochaetaceae bacterium]